MNFDTIHDIQHVFRKVVDSMSRPGLITNLQAEAERLDIAVGTSFSATVLLAMMVLDTEVTFKVVSDQEAEITGRLNQLTYTQNADTARADYIFILNDAPQEKIDESIRQAKVGTLTNPHESATIIIETDQISRGGKYSLTGPGIEKESPVNISFMGNWLEIRQEKNAEFPLGIDFMIVDKNHNLLCLPRTTRIERKGGGYRWDM